MVLPVVFNLDTNPGTFSVALSGLDSDPRVSQNLDAISTVLARGLISKPRASLALVRCCYN